eukprot:2058285-Prymnesium_polylepis.1
MPRAHAAHFSPRPQRAMDPAHVPPEFWMAHLLVPGPLPVCRRPQPRAPRRSRALARGRSP